MPKANKASSLLKTIGKRGTAVGPAPDEINYRDNPKLYRILVGERNVFGTQPYSNELKPMWRFKDKAAAKESAESLYERFEGFRAADDFVGMDIARKFVQMGYTRSTRYALRPGGRKYDKDTGEEIPRTGEIADQEKYEGSLIFKEYWNRIEEDDTYVEQKERWRVDVEGKKPKASAKKDKDVKVEEKHEKRTKSSGRKAQGIKSGAGVKEESKASESKVAEVKVEDKHDKQ